MLIGAISGTQINSSIDWLEWIEIGRTYDVYGVSIHQKTGIEYLIHGDNPLKPFWLPAELFVIIDATIPNHWKFSDLTDNEMSWYKDRSGYVALLVYEKLVSSGNHFSGIIERDEKELSKFLAEVEKS